VCGVDVGLQERLADRRGDHRVLALLHVRQGVAHPVCAAALPRCAEHAGNRQAQPVRASEITGLTPCKRRDGDRVNAVLAAAGYNPLETLLHGRPLRKAQHVYQL
jgi:hypothetical protein